MQTTLLGLAIAVILALVAALVGPQFVDWTKYRPQFEAEAARIVGEPVRIAGPIDVRLLPVPSVALRDIEVGSRAAPVFGARMLRAELSLPALMRGEWRASVLRLDGPEFATGLDDAGKFRLGLPTLALDPERLSIERLEIVDGRVALDDMSTRTHALLDKLSFSGEVRSLIGPIRGEGAFSIADQRFGYRLGVGRLNEAGSRIKLGIDPADRALAFEADGTLTIEQGAPRFEGTVALARPAGVVLSSGKAVANDPWRITGHVKGDARGALFEQVDLQYGPDERSIRMSGTANLKLGVRPSLDGVLSARQVDLDRTLAAADASRVPMAVLRNLPATFGEFWRSSLALSIGIGIDAVTLGGATLQSVRGDIRAGDNTWSIDSFEFRAPGFTQVRLSGHIDGDPKSAEFSGPVAIKSADPRALLAWVTGSDRARASIGPLQLRGDVALGRERIAVERVKAEFDRKSFDGRIAYAFASESRPARLDAALTAAEFDLDGAIAFGKTLLEGTPIEWPGEIALALDVGRTIFAGVEAKSTTADVRFDANGLRIERLAVADFGGAALKASGQVDTSTLPPRGGSIALSLDAQKLDGVLALLNDVAPRAADTLRRYAATLAPAKVEASLKVEPAAGTKTTVKLSLDGRLGALRLAVAGEGTGELGALSESEIRGEGKLVSDDGALLTALGLDRLFPADRKPVNLTFNASGRSTGEMRLSGKMAGESFEATAAGTMRPADATGLFDVTVASADLRSLRRDSGTLPVALKGRVEMTSDTLTFSDLSGKVGSAPLAGSLTLTLGQPARVDGRIVADTADVPAIVAIAIGMPPQAGSPGSWPTQAFVQSPLGDLAGRIEFEAAQAALAPAVVVQKLRTVIDVAPNEIAFDAVTGTIGGGALTGQAKFRKLPGGIALRLRVAVANADASSLIHGSGQPPIVGRMSSQFELEASGANPAALIGAMRGTGSVTLEGVQLVGLDTQAIAVAIRAVERGMPITSARVSDLVVRVMDSDAMPVSWASAPVDVNAGRARIGKLVTPPHTADIAVSGSVDLVDQTIDTNITLYGISPSDAPVGQRPEVTVALKGALGAPKRTIDVSALVSWLTLQAVDREARRLEAEEQEAKRRAVLEANVGEPQLAPAVPISPPVPVPMPAPQQPRAPSSAPAASHPQPPIERRSATSPRAAVETAPLPLVPSGPISPLSPR